jgi:uncharacterized membrane protein
VASTSLYRRGSAEFDRGVSFFDAVYGFAITLLITTVHIPAAKYWHSLRSLLGSSFGSELFGFVLSFIVIAVFWRVNYRLIGMMSGMSSRVIVSNITCVFFIILIPLTTQAENSDALDHEPLSVALYAGNIGLASLAQFVMYRIANGSGLVKVIATPASRAFGAIGSLLVPFVFGLSIPIAFWVGTRPAQYLWASLIVLFPLFGWLERRANNDRDPTVVPPQAVDE